MDRRSLITKEMNQSMHGVLDICMKAGTKKISPLFWRKHRIGHKQSAPLLAATTQANIQ